MNKVSGIGGDTLLRTADLAARGAFRLGEALVNPGTRTVSGPGGEADLEPRVMQVLVVLADAAGTVVTRETLFQRCWGNVFVGDDSLNRAVAGVRKVAETVAAGSFTVETVPRTGYKLVVNSGAGPGSPATSLTRRHAIAIGGSAATFAALGAGIGWWSNRSRNEREFTALMERGVEALETADPADHPEQYFRKAVALRPGRASAQGAFAYAQAIRAENAERGTGLASREAEQASRAALAIDSNEPYARLAQTVIQQSMLDFAATEDRHRAVLASAPGNLSAMRELWSLLQCVGRSRESLAMIERALRVKPLAPGNHYPWAQLLWILGRVPEADRVIDNALQYWPTHRFVRFARFSIFAYAGRPRAALAMLENEETRPQSFSPEAVALWRISLAALDQRSPATIASARAANIEAAKRNLRLAGQAASVLSALGEVDAAFEITNAHFAVGGRPGVRPQPASNRPPVKSNAWRFAPWLFTPPTAALRADPRFESICDQIGLTEYWAKRGIKPDYQLGIT
ncbi:MAG TPA: winged helix-turn-helix domain-containing protein [Sphingomicrobium sp.]|nr:winged helix-turn-helix domain-containing protein [Sphingomicrobium sp.]